MNFWRFGRKPAFFLVCILLSASGIFASQSTSIPMYAASKLFSGLAAGGTKLKNDLLI